MKFKFLLAVLLLVGVTINSYAVGFPVKRAVATASVDTNSNNLEDVDEVLTSPAAAAAGKSLTTALLLFFFLGFVAAHRWYVGKPIGWNILYIVTLGGLGIWAIVDLVNMLTGKWDLN